MYKLTTYRLIAQIASFILAISLRNISDEALGTYAISLSILSVISAVITYEGTFLVISRNIYPSNFFTNLKVNRVVWVCLTFIVLLMADLGPTITMCLIGFLLTLDFEYFINLITLGERVHGKEERFRKYLGRKIIFTEFLFPLISVLAIYFDLIFYVLPIYILIFLVVNLYMFVFAYKKSINQPLKKILPSFKGTTTAFLKRTDSQLQRLVIGAVFGTGVLGAIYPALIIGRAGSIIGNIWYTYYFNRSKQIISVSNTVLRNLPVIILSILIMCSAYAYISKWFFSYFFEWDVEVLVYATFFFINLQFLYKTFLRSIITNIRKILLFNAALSLSIFIKLAYASIFSVQLLDWLFLSILVDVVVFCFLQFYIFLYNKQQNKHKEIKVMRVTNLPTKDFPASGLTSHMISLDTDEKIAVPFPKNLCLHNYQESKIISDLKIDLRNKKLFKWVRFILSVYYSFRLSRIASKNDINIVHVHWVPLMFIKLFSFKTRKFVLTIHGEDARYLDYFPFKQIAKKFSKIYVVGSYWTKYLKDRGFIINEIPNFSPISQETKEAIEYRLKKSKKNKYTKLCTIASEKDHKNLKIFKNIPDNFQSMLDRSELSIEIVGISENYYKKVTACTEIPFGVRLPGRLSRDDTLFTIASSDLLLIPSFTEGNPKVVWESVEMGTFPIISKPLTFYGYAHDKYPFRFDPYNSKEFWEIINFALSKKQNFVLDDYFVVSDHISIRKEYNNLYLKILGMNFAII
tara:strand:- start:99 stop:2339 length:2241 start_codon:yes stop_codon:yes gene_type:complete